MMSKFFAVTLLAVAVSGCQLQQTLKQTGNQIVCDIQPDMIADWTKLERHYQKASGEDKKAMLALISEQTDKVALALLLSQPENTAKQLRQSIQLFEAMEIKDSSLCDSDRYLALRHHYTKGVLILQQALNSTDLERKQLQQERNTLQQNIEALTDIERDISIQKDGEEK